MRILALLLNSLLLPVSGAVAFIPFSTSGGPPYPASLYIPLSVPVAALLSLASLIASPRRFLFHRVAIAANALLVVGFVSLWLYIVLAGSAFGRNAMLGQVPALLGLAAVWTVSAIAAHRRMATQHELLSA